VVEPLMGLETEYGFSAVSRSGQGLSRDQFLARLQTLAAQRLPHVPDNNGGVFLGNGARFYIDHGGHPELSTPECTNPWDVVRHAQAGHRILGGLHQELESSHSELGELLFLRGNVDYSGGLATWGCHESYLTRGAPSSLVDQIVPHLVSRVVYSGAGGFDPTSPGVSFVLSPRSLHLERVVSGSSTEHRGIFHTKDESLCGHGYKRLHILCGDSLCSETSQWLMVATTALVVAMADAGTGPGEGVRLAAPLRALRTIVRDPSCRAKVRLANGDRLTAVGIQRHYLAEAEARARESFMPAWTKRVLPRWRETLDRLEQAPDELSRTLDWAIKLALFREHVRRRGMQWTLLRAWTSVLTRVEKGQDAGREKLTPTLLKKGYRPRDLDRVRALRDELFEIDTRFGQLGDRGVFTRLDRAGVLEHRLTTGSEIERAMRYPPADTRARLRGETIRKLGNANSRSRCGWEAFWDLDRKRALDLSHPFETRERWGPIPERESVVSALPEDVFTQLRRLCL
jgi:proteasome accessory factor A